MKGEATILEGKGQTLPSRVPIVSVSGLRKSYGKQEVVKEVSFSVAEGEVFGLIGPDGAGKSTIMKILAGVLSFDGGDVQVLGRRLPQQAEDLKGEIGFMPQGIGLNLYADLSLHENIEFFGELREIPPSIREEREEMLMRVTGLGPFRNRLVRNLSGGMKQKLGLCCALIGTPKLILLDEPTTGVDPLSKREFWDLIFRFVNEEGTTVVLSTSYMEEAERCHKIAFMMEGRSILQGDLEVLLRGSGHLEEAFLQILTEKSPKRFTFHLPSIFQERKKGKGYGVEVRGLRKRFGDFEAVKGVTFSIENGEIFGLLGPNGAGKTTTIKMIVGLLEPTHGDIRIAGLERKGGLERIKMRIGYMSQLFSLYRDLTVSENIEFKGTLYGLKGKELRIRRDQVLEIADLKGRERRLVRDIPLGMKQRLALGCAVMHSPDVLFLDEPTSGVDPIARRHFWEIITRLSTEAGITSLVTTHHLVEAQYCHRLALMNEGAVVAIGSPEELRREVTSERGGMLELKVTHQGKALKILKSKGYLAYPFGRAVHIWKGSIHMDGLFEILKREGIEVESVREILVSMEDIFIHFIERSLHAGR